MIVIAAMIMIPITTTIMKTMLTTVMIMRYDHYNDVDNGNDNDNGTDNAPCC